MISFSGILTYSDSGFFKKSKIQVHDDTIAEMSDEATRQAKWPQQEAEIKSDKPVFQNFSALPSLKEEEQPTQEEANVQATTSVSGILTAIEYVDRDGDLTRRRVTMKKISEQWGHATLYALCHEHDAFRSFRLSRIQCFISGDGEVRTPEEFWAELEIDPEKEAKQNFAQKEKDKFVKSALGPQMILLTALSRCDGTRDQRETDAILDHIEIAHEDAGISLTDAKVTRIRKKISILRPTEEMVEIAMEEIFGRQAVHKKPNMPSSQRRSLLRAMREVAEADHVLQREEIQFFEEMQRISQELD